MKGKSIVMDRKTNRKVTVHYYIYDTDLYWYILWDLKLGHSLILRNGSNNASYTFYNNENTFYMSLKPIIKGFNIIQ